MKTKTKRIFIVLLVCILILSAVPITASADLTGEPPSVYVTVGDYVIGYYENDKDDIYISKYLGTDTNIVIPEELGGYKICGIGYDAFYHCTSITSVTIPNSITYIGPYAFSGCTALTSIVIPDSVIRIGRRAFKGCTSLTNISIPDSMTYIGDDAFYDTAYYNNESNWKNDILYIGNHLIKAKNTYSGACTVKADTKTIADEAFYNCSLLTSITIPNSVMNIGYSTFYNCTSLTSVTLSENITSIGYETFEDCASLTSITIPNSVTSIGSYAFSGCTSLTNIPIPDSVTYIGGSAFQDCTALASITIPNSVTYIGGSAFQDCTALASITIPNSVTEIGSYAFRNCSSLTSINIPDSVTSIDDATFSNCTSLTSITIPDSVTSIDRYAFKDSSLTTIYGYAGSYVETFASENGYTFIALQKLTDTKTGVSVGEGSFGNFAENTALNVEKLSAEENAITYDITLTVNGEIAQPANAVTVKIPVPEAMDGAQCKVYRQETDGTYTDMHAIYQNGYMVFTTDHFSTYILTTQRLGIVLGDVNGDDKINAVDARWVLQAASGARTFDATQTAAADVNGDGKINAVDARWILQAASGARVL
ncbi:MAG: leucine-rich repeat protein [Candidatus Fimenecus sp.]